MIFTKVAVGFSSFALIFGLGNCASPLDFLSGFFAGGAMVTAYIIYEEEANIDGD